MTATSRSTLAPAPRIQTSDPEPASSGFNSRIRAGFHRALCRMQGHDNLLHFGAARMFLKCTSCGRESPGWIIRDTRPPGRRSDGHLRGDLQSKLVRLRRTA